jgi:endonuclease-8
MFNGAVLELDRGVARHLGPDILADPPDFDGMLARVRHADQQRPVGDALLDQRLVAGIGNLWKAESLWAARVSPWRALADVSDGELRAVLEHAHRLMRGRLDGARGRAQVYRRKGRACPRCGTPIRSWPQGDGARMAYWCPQCQKGEEPTTA